MGDFLAALTSHYYRTATVSPERPQTPAPEPQAPKKPTKDEAERQAYMQTLDEEDDYEMENLDNVVQRRTPQQAQPTRTVAPTPVPSQYVETVRNRAKLIFK